MPSTTQKREVGLLNATPEKRMYWSIISDYDLKTGLCELIDNAVDQWVSNGKKKKLEISVVLDAEQQTIRLSDTAGGVREQDLRVLVAPGASRNDPSHETIGIFGVGSKRAVVALAESIQIRTRARRERGFQIDIDDRWLKTDDWDIPHFVVPDAEEGVTEILLSNLRKSFDSLDVGRIASHIGDTYSRFIAHKDCRIRVNGIEVEAKEFDTWAYPRGFEPQRLRFEVPLGDDGTVRVEVSAGLILDRDPVAENYGVYFYCNDRLIVKECRVRDVGYFVTAEAGVPHPDASLCRAIVKFNGPAKPMPWNSSKSAINFDHALFRAIRPKLIQFVSYYSSLSRRLKGDWEQKVYRKTKGSIRDIDGEIAPQAKIRLPPLPRVNKARADVLKTLNRRQIHKSPWTLGLVEAIAAVDVISRQKLETRNRIALILLDSNFEIALKEFIVHRHDLFPVQSTDISQLFKYRHTVIAALVSKVQLDPELLSKANHYYLLRNKLVHERATVDILESDVEIYRETVEAILRELFDLRFDVPS